MYNSKKLFDHFQAWSFYNGQLKFVFILSGQEKVVNYVPGWMENMF